MHHRTYLFIGFALACMCLLSAVLFVTHRPKHYANEREQQMAACGFGDTTCLMNAGDVSVCDGMHEEKKKDCVSVASRQAAVLSGDVTYCGSIQTTAEEQRDCYDETLLHTAAATHDVTLCNRITTNYARSQCQALLGTSPSQ